MYASTHSSCEGNEQKQRLRRFPLSSSLCNPHLIDVSECRSEQGVRLLGVLEQGVEEDLRSEINTYIHSCVVAFHHYPCSSPHFIEYVKLIIIFLDEQVRNSF